MLINSYLDCPLMNFFISELQARLEREGWTEEKYMQLLGDGELSGEDI